MTDPAPSGSSPVATVFRPDRLGLFPTLVVLVGTVPLAGTARPLLVLLLLPLGTAVWILRARVAATGAGVQVCNGLGVRRVPWAQVEGFDATGRGPVRLLVQGRRPVPLTALGRRRLPQLLRACEQEQGVTR